MADKPDITPELLRQLLRYEPLSGDLFWLERKRHLFSSDSLCKRWNTIHKDKIATSYVNKDGYKQICIFGVVHKAHRVVWAHQIGDWPKRSIDHINGIRSDNRIQNLRDVSTLENCRNSRKRKSNKSGFTGVSWNKRQRKWHAVISIDCKTTHIGFFKEKSDAVEARLKAQAKLGYHPNHGL